VASLRIDNASITEPRPAVPLLRWAGSKRKVLPRLASFWRPQFKRYVEPFAGSAALFFWLQPERALLGDINSDLISAYRVIRERPDEVHAAVSGIKRSEREYYRVRSQDTARLGAFARAVRFIYLNRHCFNGIYRTNAEGHFNVPYGHSRTGTIPPVEHFRRAANLLHRASLREADFGMLLRTVTRGDFVYLDPPYAVESRRVFRQYNQREFSTRDLERLSAQLRVIDRRGATFLVSYAECREARDLFRYWNVRRIRVRRHVAGFASNRRHAAELLVTNNEFGSQYDR
jgi:DNA adenine methylase